MVVVTEEEQRAHSPLLAAGFVGAFAKINILTSGDSLRLELCPYLPQGCFNSKFLRGKKLSGVGEPNRSGPVSYEFNYKSGKSLKLFKDLNALNILHNIFFQI